MTINIEVPEKKNLRPKIMVLGVGGAGGNAVNNMIELGLQGVDFAVANTDAQALESSKAAIKIQLGEALTEGLGAGSSPDVGGKAAEESIENVLNLIAGYNMLFITAGMGGGTGTGAAPVIAKASRERGVLTVGVVTKPFHFEGSYRMDVADKGTEELYKALDTLIVIPNQNLFHKATEHTTFAEAFQMVDNVLYSGVKSITDLMTMPGLINLDFADIRTIMGNMGKAMMGTGEASGERRALEAAEAAISNPLLDNASMRGASGVLINISGGLDMTLFEADEAAQRVKDELAQDANIIFGSTFDKSLENQIRVSVVATGIDAEHVAQVKRNELKAKEFGHKFQNKTSNKFNQPESSTPKKIEPKFEKKPVEVKESQSKNNNNNIEEFSLNDTNIFIPPQPVTPTEFTNNEPENNNTTPISAQNIEQTEINFSSYSDRKEAQNDEARANFNNQEERKTEASQITATNQNLQRQEVTPEPSINNYAKNYPSSQNNNLDTNNDNIDKGKIGKSLSGLFNFFREGNEENQQYESNNFNNSNYAGSNTKQPGSSQENNYQSAEKNSGLSISDDILNVPTFLRNKKTGTED